MKSAEIKQLTDDELAKTIADNKQELLNLRLQAQTGQLENTARVNLVRKDIARCCTEQSARASKAE